MKTNSLYGWETNLGVEANGANDEFEKHLPDLMPFMSYLARTTIG